MRGESQRCKREVCRDADPRLLLPTGIRSGPDQTRPSTLEDVAADPCAHSRAFMGRDLVKYEVRQDTDRSELD